MDKNRIIKKLNILAVAVLILTTMLFGIFIEHYGVLSEESDYMPKITVEEKTVHRGQTFTISVDLSENEGLISLKLSLNYNNTVMRLTGVDRGAALESLTFTTINTQTSIGYEIIPFELLWDGTLPDNTDGNLVTFTFESFSDAPVGIYPINLTYDSKNTNKDYGLPISVNIINGSVTLVKGEFEAVYYDWDGTELYRKDYNADDTPTYEKEIPTRIADECYSYEFSGWKGIVSDQPNVIKYKADYTLTPKTYQVFYYVDGINNDYFDGVITLEDYYKAEEFAYGAFLSGEYPLKQRYIFSGWFTDDKFSEPFTDTHMPSKNLTLYGYFVYDIRTTQIPKIKLSNSEEGEGQITVYAEMVSNTGFNGLVLTLDYDMSAMEFVDFTKGSTFAGLQFDTTDTESGLGAENFKFYYEHSENTYETGIFLELHFRILNKSVTGVYNVTFSVGNTDATYINGNSGIRYTAVEIIGASIPIGKIYEWERSAEDNANIIIKSDNGMPVDTALKVALVPQSVHNIDNSAVKQTAGSDMELMAAYKLQLVRMIGGAEIEVEPDGLLTVEIKLTAVQQACKRLALYYVNDDGETTLFPSEREGEVLRFRTDHLSLWAIVGEANTVGGRLSDAAVILISMPILLAIATMGYALIIIGKNKKMKEKID